MKEESFKFNFNPDSLSVSTPNVEDFGGCCGAKILTGFTEDTKSGVVSRIKSQRSNAIEDYFYNWRTAISKIPYKFRRTPSNQYFERFLQPTISSRMPDFKKGTLYFVILNNVQSWIGLYLKKHGFRLVSDRIVNHNSGNRLYVWLRDPETVKGKSIRKRTFGR